MKFNSNELIITPNYDNILRDYDILEYTGRIDRAVIDALRSAGGGNLIVSAVHINRYESTRRQAFFLAKKGGAVGEALHEVIQKHPDLAGKFKYKFIRNPAFSFEGQEHILLRLFLNTLSMPRTTEENVGVTNLTGRLVCISGKGKGGTIFAVEPSIDQNMRLQLEARSYCNYFKKRKEIERDSRLNPEDKRKKIANLAQYTYNKETLTMKRVYDERPKNSPIYTKAALNGKKAVVKHISWYRDFEKTKVGVWGAVLAQYFYRDLDKYIAFRYKEYNAVFEEGFSKPYSQEIRSRLKIYLERKQPVIVNLVGNEGKKAVEVFQELVKEITGSIFDRAKTIQESRPNIVVVHPEDSYEPGEDDYIEDSSAVIQHLTTSNEGLTSNEKKSVAEFILFNLVIKDEIKNGVLELVSPAELGLGMGWSFVVPIYRRLSNGGRPMLTLFSFVAATINGDDKVSYETIEGPDSVNFIKWSPYFENANQSPEGLIISPEGDVMAISKRGEYVMWDALAIRKELNEVDQGRQTTFRANQVISFLQKEYPEVAEAIEGLGELRISGADLYDKCIKQVVKNNQKKPEIVEAVYQEFGVRIQAFFKSERKLAEIFGTLKGVNMVKVDSHNALYFVGTKDTPYKGKNNAITLRRVVALEGHNRFDELLATMTPDYVKNKELTVVPWIFKYLREYVRMYQPEAVLVR